MALIPGIHTTVARNISLTELGLRGSLRVTQTLAKASPRVLRCSMQRKRPPAGELRELFNVDPGASLFHEERVVMYL